MNIKKFLNYKTNLDNNIYANSIRRGLASTIDIWIVLFARAFIIQIAGSTFLNKVMMDFTSEFSEHFGTEIVKKTPEHINFVIHHRIFYYSLFLYAILISVGMIYHAYLNSSAWRGTIGKRIMKIMIVRSDSSPIGFSRGITHYFLSIAPFIFIIYLISYQIINEVTLFQAITATEINVFLSISFVLWVQIHLFTKKKTTVYDLICDTILINGKTSAKTPWVKKTDENLK